MPRRLVESAGVSMSHIPVSDTTIMSALLNSSRLASTKGLKPRLPVSSSPSISTEMRHGMVPVSSNQARKAESHICTWPLSSTAPRA